MGLDLRRVAVASLVVALMCVACGTPDPNEFCDGVQRTLGGCDENQPTYEWRAGLLDTLSVIDEDEDEPA